MKKNAAEGHEKTKPKQTQFLKRQEMSATVYFTKNYENKPLRNLPENKVRHEAIAAP